MILIIIILCGAVYLYLQQPKFGRLPQKEQLTLMSRSVNYQDAQFQNLVPIEILTEKGNSMLTWAGFIFRDRSQAKPQMALPSLKTDLLSLSTDENVIVWLGHSSYFIRLDGKTILIDPVFSQEAAPIPWVNSAFKGSLTYTPDELPEIDYLLISHDHWDHLDYPTISALNGRVKQVVVGLGVGENFAYWGYDPDSIQELDWYEKVVDERDIAIHFLPAQHFSGRLLERNKTLWGGFAIITPHARLFFSGDSGYGPHFADIGRRFDGFDMAILDSGQYDENWPAVHMFPEEAVQAAQDLGAKALLPGHIGKFSLAFHSWDEPFKRLYMVSQTVPYHLLTPKMGEPLYLNKPQQVFEPWW